MGSVVFLYYVVGLSYGSIPFADDLAAKTWHRRPPSGPIATSLGVGLSVLALTLPWSFVFLARLFD
jgi:hypothetical protein